MKTFFKAIHKWLSIPTGIIITIICLTGSILVFQDEILETVYHKYYFVEEIKEETIPLDKLIPMVNSQLEDNKVADVRIYSDPQRSYIMQLSDGFRINAFVNQYTGEVLGIYKTKESFFFKMMQIHRWLMDGSRTIGKNIVGISTLLLIVILISGTIIWLPKNRKQWKKAFSIKWKGGKRQLYYNLHRVLGIYGCIIILLCAATGLMWSFEWYRNGVFRIFGGEISQNKNQNEKNNEKNTPEITHWNKVVENIKEQNPDFDYIRISHKSASVHQKNAPNSRATDSYLFDPASGHILKTTLYKQQSKNTRIWDWVYSLHVGNYWGIYSKIFTCIASLIGASLPITGYYIFYAKHKRQRKGKSVSP